MRKVQIQKKKISLSNYSFLRKSICQRKILIYKKMSSTSKKDSLSQLRNSSMKTFHIHRKSLKNYPTEPRESDANDYFGSFLYKDQFTHRRYKISKLKNHKRAQTGQPHKNEAQSNAQYYLQELNMFRSIRENRNKNILNTMKKGAKTVQDKNMGRSKKMDINRIKQEIRKQILNMNQEYLREYLYHQQPFNELFSKLHKVSNVGALNEKKIKELKATIKECGERNKKKEGVREKINTVQNEGKVKRLREEKKKIQIEIDSQFQKIWGHLQKEISRKIRKEGEYTWQNYKHKLYR